MANTFSKKAAIRLGLVGVEQQRAETSFIAPPNGIEHQVVGRNPARESVTMRG